MQVIMLKTGDLKQVAEGYARNYLFPNKLAVAATAAAQKTAEATRTQVAAERQAEVDAQSALADRLKGQAIAVTAKASDSGKLFAALHADDIIAALAKVDFTVTAAQLNFPPIKQTGEHTIKVQFPGREAVALVINVMAE